jgi:16S rRNA (cytosine967-C5)-methyltransferase
MSRPRTVSRGGALPVTARRVAARVVERVERDRAYLAPALDVELARNPVLDGRDRALATELAYGVVRTAPALTTRIERFAKRPLSRTEGAVRAHLLVAAYQLSFSERIPPFAVVSEAVQAIRDQGGAAAAGFANAVLRKLAAAADPLALRDAVLQSVPRWLYDALVASSGVGEARALVGADARPPPFTVRPVAGAPLPEELANGEPAPGVSGARRLRKAGDLRKLAGFAEGRFVVQEAGAQLVALALGARHGERVLDACTGRGGKALLLSERVGSSGTLALADLHPQKLEQAAREFARLGLAEPQRYAVDWAAGSGEVPEGFDRVLVDAPCSGTGTLRRRPEIMRRLEPEDPARIARQSAAILRAAALRARKGGCVVFAVCSVLPVECEAVVDSVADCLEPEHFDAPELEALGVRGTARIRLLPLAHGTDGFFIARFRRR